MNKRPPESAAFTRNPTPPPHCAEKAQKPTIPGREAHTTAHGRGRPDFQAGTLGSDHGARAPALKVSLENALFRARSRRKKQQRNSDKIPLSPAKVSLKFFSTPRPKRQARATTSTDPKCNQLSLIRFHSANGTVSPGGAGADPLPSRLRPRPRAHGSRRRCGSCGPGSATRRLSSWSPKGQPPFSPPERRRTQNSNNCTPMYFQEKI